MICTKEFTIATTAACFTNSTPLPTAYYFVSYSTTLVPQSGLPGAFTKVGALPTGLSLNPATGTISGTPSNASEVGTFNFTAIFTPTDTGIPPCSQAFVLVLGIYCVPIEDLTWTIADTHDPSQITVSMAGGDGSFSINRPLNGLGAKYCRLTSSVLLCLPAAYAEYAATIEADWSVFLHEDAGGGQAGINLSARRNGLLLLPMLTRQTSGSDITDSGTLTIATGLLQAGVSYTFWIDIESGCTTAGQVVFSGVIRVRPLTPP